LESLSEIRRNTHRPTTLRPRGQFSILNGRFALLPYLPPIPWFLNPKSSEPLASPRQSEVKRTKTNQIEAKKFSHPARRLSVITLSDGIGFEINEGMAFRPDESALNVGQFGTLLARWKRFSEA
jgi:hypothetical protein